MRDMFIDSDTAINKITTAITATDSDANVVQTAYTAERLVLSVLDYCNRDDFPLALVFSVVDLINKFEANSDNDGLPLNKIRQDDTELDFAVNSVDAYSDSLFDALKPKLNLYRRLKSL